jgi:hypothetical protein
MVLACGAAKLRSRRFLLGLGPEARGSIQRLRQDQIAGDCEAEAEIFL